MKPLQLPLESWLTTILRIVNDTSAASSPAVRRLRQLVAQLIDDTLPGRSGFIVHRLLPPLEVSVSKQRGVRLASHLGPSNEHDIREADEQGHAAWLAEQYAQRFEGAVYVISADPLGRRVRLCSWCGRFYLAKRDHRRLRTFCSPTCRHAFEHAKRDPKEWADYMRELRNVRKRRQTKR